MYISSLSDEDREKFKDLIEEFRDRDARISRDCEEARRSIRSLEDVGVKMLGRMKELEVASERLLKNTADLYLNLLDKKKMHS